MTTRDDAIMQIVRDLSTEPQTDRALGLLNKLASMIVASMPLYEGMGDSIDQMRRRQLGWD